MKKALLVFCLLLPATSAYPLDIRGYDEGPNEVINYYEKSSGMWFYFDGMGMMYVCEVIVQVTSYKFGPPKITHYQKCN